MPVRIDWAYPVRIQSSSTYFGMFTQLAGLLNESKQLPALAGTATLTTTHDASQRLRRNKLHLLIRFI